MQSPGPSPSVWASVSSLSLSLFSLSLLFFSSSSPSLSTTEGELLGLTPALATESQERMLFKEQGGQGSHRSIGDTGNRKHAFPSGRRELRRAKPHLLAWM